MVIFEQHFLQKYKIYRLGETKKEFVGMLEKMPDGFWYIDRRVKVDCNGLFEDAKQEVRRYLRTKN